MCATITAQPKSNRSSQFMCRSDLREFLVQPGGVGDENCFHFEKKFLF